MQDLKKSAMGNYMMKIHADTKRSAHIPLATIERYIHENKSLERQLERSNKLLHALSQAQLRFAAGSEITSVLSTLLSAFLSLTQARQAYIAEHISTGSPFPPISLHRRENQIVAGEATEAVVQVARHALHLGRTTLIHPAYEEVTGIMPPDSTTSYYLAFPITVPNTTPMITGAPQSVTLGLLLITGSITDFDPTLVEFMQPLLATCAQMITAHRAAMQCRAAEVALAQEQLTFAQRLAERTSELSYANNELSRAARAKDEFLATMNHELRTPLHAVMLYAQSLQTQRPGPLNDRQRRAVGGILESAGHLLLLINDFLDIAKLDAGKLDLDVERIDVKSACQSTLRLVSELAIQKGIELAFAFDSNVQSVAADGRRLKQMLVNLLSNAIKFTPEQGKIGLEVRGKPHDNLVQFTVWDTGIGIAPADLKRLFQPFVQLEGYQSHHFGGTGLGLFLVYRMAELHGGSVTVNSEPGSGSRFTISLPWHHHHLTSTPDALPTRSTANGHKGVEEGLEIGAIPHASHNLHHNDKTSAAPSGNVPTILIADDNETNLSVLSDFLHEWNCRLLFARTGAEALHRCKTETPNLVLMDIQMPGMHGFDVIRALRSDPELCHTPIIALTALTMPGDRERCFAVGADDYLSKPIHVERLTLLLNTYLRNNSPNLPHKQPLESSTNPSTNPSTNQRHPQ
jgi:signal transduction histidine kinase/DNA-binding NarL/FixJ family response regulator